MEKKFFILIGRSGSGKGTQAKLLQDYLKDKGAESVLHITTGGGFRNFIEEENYTAILSKYVNDKGLLQPEFLAIWNWSSIFINNLREEDSVILDGAPRKTYEVPALHSAINFYGFSKPIVIYIDVSEGVSKERLLERGRGDDKEEEIARRMDWFDVDVLSVIDSYKNDQRYDFVHVNGEKSVIEVHDQIIEKLALLD